MRDQAAELRNLVLRAARQQRLDVGPLPRLTWMLGASPSVGATTISVALAEWLADNGYRIVLINASAEIESFCRLTNIDAPDHEWLKRRANVHEVLQAGRAGLQIVASLGDCMSDAQAVDQRQWLLRQLGTLRPHADLVMIKGGAPNEIYGHSVLQWASETIVCSTPETRAIMNAYACLKAMVQFRSSHHTSLLVNRVREPNEAIDTWQRIVRSSRRFLGLTPDLLGQLHDDPALRFWYESHRPSLSEMSESIQRGVRELGMRLIQECNDRIPMADAA